MTFATLLVPALAASVFIISNQAGRFRDSTLSQLSIAKGTSDKSLVMNTPTNKKVPAYVLSDIIKHYHWSDMIPVGLLHFFLTFLYEKDQQVPVQLLQDLFPVLYDRKENVSLKVLHSLFTDLYERKDGVRERPWYTASPPGQEQERSRYRSEPPRQGPRRDRSLLARLVGSFTDGLRRLFRPKPRYGRNLQIPQDGDFRNTWRRPFPTRPRPGPRFRRNPLARFASGLRRIFQRRRPYARNVSPPPRPNRRLRYSHAWRRRGQTRPRFRRQPLGRNFVAIARKFADGFRRLFHRRGRYGPRYSRPWPRRGQTGPKFRPKLLDRSFMAIARKFANGFRRRFRRRHPYARNLPSPPQPVQPYYLPPARGYRPPPLYNIDPYDSHLPL